MISARRSPTCKPTKRIAGRAARIFRLLLGGLSPISARGADAIAKEAYTYGFPLVDNYRIMFAYWIDKSSPEYKGSINTIQNSSHVYGPEDKAIQTPNSDTGGTLGDGSISHPLRVH